jgi:hypothetical protein
MVLAALGSCALANPLGYCNMAGNTSWSSQRLMGRDDSEFYPENLSYIKSMAALGDSYSAGIGAGERIGQ